MRPLAPLLAALVGASLSGCPDGGRSADPDAAVLDAATDAAPADAAPVDAATADADPADAGPPPDPLTVIFADADDMWLTADDGRVPYVWGFQGGTMIRPAVVINHPDFAVGDPVFVRLEHAPDPAAPEAYTLDPIFERFTLEVPLEESPYGPSTGALDDQLDWVALDGLRLQLTATVEGLDETWTRPLELYLHAPGPHPCDPISQPPEGEGDPCQVAVFRGTVVMHTIEAAGDPGRCGTPVAMTGDGPPGDLPGSMCPQRLGVTTDWYLDVPIRTSWDGPTLTVECAAGLGIVPGAQLPGALWVRYGTGCDPRPEVVLDVDTTPCRCD